MIWHKIKVLNSKRARAYSEIRGLKKGASVGSKAKAKEYGNDK